MNKKNDRIEATLLTFKMVLDAKGNLWTDIGGLPLKDVKHMSKYVKNTLNYVKNVKNMLKIY